MAATTASRGTAAKWVLGAPLILFTAVLVAYPVFQGVQTGFFGLSLQDPEIPFTGLSNFTEVLTDPGFLSAARFTIVFALVVAALETVLGFALALLMNRQFPGKRVFFTMLLVPIMIAPALMGVMFRLLLNGDIGLVPELLRGVGLDISLFAPDTVVPLLVVLDVLQWTPFTFLIMYAGLQSFPTDVLEAAQIDGAGRWRKMFSVTLPGISTMIAVMLILNVGQILTVDLDKILLMYNPSVYETADVIQTYVYRLAFASEGFPDYSYAAAVGLIQGLIAFVLVVATNRASRRFSDSRVF